MTATTAANNERDSSQDGLTTLERLAEDMVARWRQGERPLTELYLERFPELGRQPEAVLELIAEELTLREEFAEPVSLADLNARFPLWPAQIRALVQCQRTLGRQTALFPSPGDVLGDFHLASELGRGSHARVFLAAQPSLGGRRVVLKLGPLAGREHLSLARLQHTHIVPLYSVHEFPTHGLRGLCLPYFGGATLADVLARLAKRGQSATVGDVFAALHRDQNGASAIAPDAESLAWKTLEGASFTDVICWIGACLADALQYAHERGLLHLDLKPSNVLLAADGVPMLLDFHLARPPLRAGDAPPPWLGGTPAYMAPEQLAALEAVRDGQPVPRALDARTDVYSLGLVLKEALGAAGRGSAGSVGLHDILDRCTAAAPDDRYPSASALAADLRRHLANLSLRGVPNRSLAERWTKWRRRQPHGLTVLLALGALLAGAIGLTLHLDRLAERVEASYQDGQTLFAQGRYPEALEALRTGESLAEGLPFHRQLHGQLHDSRLTAERAKAALEVHQFCEQVRPYYAADFATPAQARLAERRCRELWDQRDDLAATLAGQATTELERRWRADLMDVAILATRLRENHSPGSSRLEVHRDALAALDQAEDLLGSSGVLCLERARHARALGQYSLADAAAQRAREYPPSTAWDHLVLGRYYLAIRDMKRALAEMDLCLQREPQSLWAHYYKGVCCLQLGRPVTAVAEFSACDVLSPNMAWCIHNLGQAYAETGEHEQALNLFDRALALDPALAASYLGRATIYTKKGRFSDALADLHSAENGGVSPAEVEYRRALVHYASGDRSAAIASLRTSLDRDSRHAQARDLLAKLLQK
jgi:tetratricopeptide (TPR) repeat protein